jgi:hypothetical protein
MLDVNVMKEGKRRMRRVVGDDQDESNQKRMWKKERM